MTADALISVPELAAALRAGDPPTLLDVRWRLAGPPVRPEYARAHLPGAVFVDLDGVWCGPPGPAGRHPLPPLGPLQEALRAAGVRAGQPVVVYDAGDGLGAARAWWTLRWAGHAAARALDGGLAAWRAAGQELTDATPAPAPGDVVLRPGGLPVLDADAAAALARTGVLLDVRAPARYRGAHEPVDPVAGRVPGAVNLPADRLHAGGDAPGYPPPERIAAALAAAGVRPGAPVGAYCGSGVTAAQAVLAMHLAGRGDAALYVGSWSNWIADPARPVATG